ncbi:MAG: hypothetical protein ABSE71_05400 [Candidatus Micrarchaeaceae archaeon]|jgi:hypothetical protein
MDDQGVAYLAFCLVILLTSLSVLPSIGKGIVVIIALAIILVGVFVILILNFADFLFVSMVCSALGITIEPAAGYRIVKQQNAIIKNVNGLFYATGYVTANLFPYVFKLEAAAENEDVKLITSPENWERAVMNIGFPFKYHVLSTGMDVQKSRDELEGKRSYEEFQMSRALQNKSADETTITNIQRRLNILQSKMDRISQGEKPIATVMYVETTAIGVSEKAAVDALTQQINDLQISMSSMDVDLSRIMGREIYTLFNFNFGLPCTKEELEASFDMQS